MGNRLRQILTFTNIGAGATSAQVPTLVINDVPKIPDKIYLDNASFGVVSCTATLLTVINNGAAVGSCNVYLEHEHSFDREYGNTAVQQLVPAPFVVGGSNGAGPSFGRLLREPQVLDVGVAAAYVAPAGCQAIFVEAVGGGGGGGGTTFASPNKAYSGGGAGGSCGMSYYDIATQGVNFTYTIGLGGTGGTTVPSNGGQGGSTTFDSDLTGPLLDIPGGAGGGGMVGGSSVAAAVGGISVPGAAVLAQIGFGGDSAGHGIRLSGLVGVSGEGGGSHFGGGGGGRSVQGSGGLSGGYGAGAGGTAAVTASAAGADGTAGVIRIWEFS